MKGITTGRGLKAFAVSMAIGLGLSACSRDYTVGYLYVTNAKANPGLITGYAIDYQSGQLSQLADSPIPSGGNNTVTVVAAPSGKTLYVINHDTSTVVQFAIGTDGKLYPENTYNVVQGNNLTGTYPVAAAVDPAGKFLFIAFTYQNGYTTVRPGPGGVATFPINTDGSLAAALLNTTVGTTTASPLPYVPVGNNPVALAISPTGGYVYVLDQDGPPGTLLSFAENATSGALTQAAAAISISAAGAGTPAGIAEDATGHFLYVTDSTTNVVYTYIVTGGVPALASRASTGLGPVGVTVDPRGKYVYVANFGSSSVSAYTLAAATGALTVAGTTIGVGTGPTCITVDPALGIYLYTSNSLNNTVSAEQLSPTTGILTQVQNTPYTSQVLPSCLVAVPNGAHATSVVQ